MKRRAAYAVILLCPYFFASWLSAQSLLQQLEQRLPGASAPSNSASPGSVPSIPPGSASAAVQQRGYLGAKLDNADEQGKTGVRVTEVVSGTPAEAGGLKGGDVITAINGKPVANLDGYDAVAVGPAGTRLQMTVDRAGGKVPVTVTLGMRPASPPAAGGPAILSPPAGGPGGATAPASEPHLGAPSLNAPGGTPPGATPPRSSPSTIAPPGGESFAQPGPSSPTPSTEPSSSLPSTLPAPGAADRGSADRGFDGGTGGIRAQPLDLGAPPTTTIGDDVPAAAPGGDAAAPSGGSPSIGISVLPLSEQARQRFGIPVRRGALIDSVRRGSPADEAGLPVGGVVVRFDDRPIESDQDLINAVRASRPGQEVEISYYEGNRLSRKPVRLAAAGVSSSPAHSGDLSDLGGAMPPASGPPASGSMPAPGATAAPRARGSGGGLLSRIDRMADNLARPQSTMTVWDPLAMASLQARVEELTSTVKTLEERLRALESKLGAGSTNSSIPSPPTSTPSFGAPSSLPNSTPALGSPAPGPHTNP